MIKKYVTIDQKNIIVTVAIKLKIRVIFEYCLALITSFSLILLLALIENVRAMRPIGQEPNMIFRTDLKNNYFAIFFIEKPDLND